MYDCLMIVTVIISVVPLMFRQEITLFLVTDKITTGIFIIDCILRLCTADCKFGEKGIRPFLRYPFSFMAIVDLLSILPVLLFQSNVWRLLKIIRLIRAMRVFKAIRYSRSFQIIGSVLNDSKESLLAVCLLAVAYIFISAMIIFSAEPDTFDTFFDAVYWATVSLTTVGYGDLCPVTTVGRLIAMISSLFGIAIVALPAGIISAGFMEEPGRGLGKNHEEEKEDEDPEI